MVGLPVDMSSNLIRDLVQPSSQTRSDDFLYKLLIYKINHKNEQEISSSGLAGCLLKFDEFLYEIIVCKTNQQFYEERSGLTGWTRSIF